MITRKVTTKEFFTKLNKNSMDLVDQFYDQFAIFQDPLVKLHSSKAIKRYYANMYENVQHIHFAFIDENSADNHTTLEWRMTLTAENFNGGKPVVVDGVSVIKFGGKEGKAVYHRDYFDLGEFVYEGLPLVGGIIRYAKRKMAGHQE